MGADSISWASHRELSPRYRYGFEIPHYDLRGQDLPSQITADGHHFHITESRMEVSRWGGPPSVHCSYEHMGGGFLDRAPMPSPQRVLECLLEALYIAPGSPAMVRHVQQGAPLADLVYLQSSWAVSSIFSDAEKKAVALLERLLSAEQLASYRKTQRFEVKGGESGATYLVGSWRSINIWDLTRRRRLCYVVPQVPLGDQLAAQKLLIEADEQAFLDAARVWEWTDPDAPRPPDLPF